MLVAACAISSNTHSTDIYYCAANGSCNTLYAYIDKRSRETDARATGGGSGIAAERY